jgi:hypothetical protein
MIIAALLHFILLLHRYSTYAVIEYLPVDGATTLFNKTIECIARIGDSMSFYSLYLIVTYDCDMQTLKLDLLNYEGRLNNYNEYVGRHDNILLTY